VTPHVTAEGTILMDVNIQKREPQIAFAVRAPERADRHQGSADAGDRARRGTTVIGGIYKVSTDQGQDRVPAWPTSPFSASCSRTGGGSTRTRNC